MEDVADTNLTSGGSNAPGLPSPQERPTTPKRPEPPPRVLYHYTDQHGLLGILQSGEIWATHVLHLNDASEIRYALMNGAVAFGKRLESETDEMIRQISEFLTSFEETGLEVVADASICYAACFCKKKDLLSQWRGYATGSAGYSIGFRSSLLGVRGMLAPIHYGKKSAQERFLEILIAKGDEASAEASSSSGGGGRLDYTDVLRDAIVEFAFEDAPFYKSRSFKAEREWRLSRNASPSKVEFRPTDFGVVPYVPINICEDGKPAIEEIRCGPSRHPDLSRRGVLRLLESVGFRDGEVRVTSTKVPLRSE